MKYSPNQLLLVVFFICLVGALAISIREMDKSSPKLTVDERLDNINAELDLIDEKLDRIDAKIDQLLLKKEKEMENASTKHE